MQTSHLEAAWQATGQRPPMSALAEYSRWRRRSRPEVLQALSRYSLYCAGQFCGMGEALSMGAIRFAAEAEGIPRERWAAFTEECQTIHRTVMKCVARKPSGG